MDKAVSIQKYLESLNHEVTEIRILTKESYMQVGGRRLFVGGTVSGYFDKEHYGEVWEHVEPYNGKVKGIYHTLQAVNPDVLARAYNRLETNVKTTVSDVDVQFFTVFPIDFDARRISGISATSKELDAVAKVTRGLKEKMVGTGLSPVVALSGNGCHLLQYIEPEPVNEDTIARFKTLGDSLAELYDLNSVDKYDTTVYNPSRIWKLYGTKASKGDHTDERPHRESVIQLPEHIERVSLVQLEECIYKIAPKVEEKSEKKPTKSNGGSSVSLVEFLDNNKIEYSRSKITPDGMVYYVTCPFNSSHTGTDAFCIERKDGKWGFKCQHSSCDGKGWQEFREVVAPKPLGNGNGDGNKKESKDEPTRTPTGEIAFTDTWNAQKFCKMHNGKLRFCDEYGRWLSYTGNRWEMDITNEVDRCATITINAMLREASEIPDEDSRMKMIQHVIKSYSNAKIKAMIERARPLLPVRSERMDHVENTRYLLNVHNGTIDLETGKIYKSTPDDYITRLADVKYSVTAECPHWVSFLKQILQDNDNIIQYIQRALGYTLTGSIGEECFFFLHGSGANGKSLFLETIKRLMGSYSQSANYEMFTQKKHEEHPTSIARLKGARFVTVVELEQGKALHESKIKWVTGGEELTGRYMRQDEFDFFPSHKIWMAANNKPRIVGTDDGIWRRIHLIPFKLTIPETERVSKEVMFAKFDSEAPGILNWLLEGCKQWQEIGLSPPAEVIEAVAEYRMEEDILAEFFESNCVSDNYGTVTKSDLYDAYLTWADNNGEKFPLNKRRFGTNVKNRGYDDGSSREGTKVDRVWKGLRLRDGGDDNPINWNEDSSDVISV